jgi:glycogen synthase
MTADTIGGVWTYCMELCRALPQVQFHLVTSGVRMQEWQKQEVGFLPNVAVYETDYLLEWMSNPWKDIEAAGEWLLRLEKELQPDVVHVNSYAFGALPFRAPKIVVAHSDVFSWWLAVKGDMPPAQWDEYYRQVQSGLQGADLVITPSLAKRNSLRELYGVTSNCRTVYNGRSNELFYKEDKQPTVFSMGRIWDEAKNIRLLVNAAPYTSCQIRIAGDQQFENNSLRVETGNTCYLGKLDTSRIAAELAAASVYVLPAKYEPFGLSALEAAYSGCALVLGDIPSLREIWQDAAVYIDTNDATALAATLNGLLSNKEKWEFYSRKAEARAQIFSSHTMAAAYLDVYSQMVQQETHYLKQEPL